MKKLLLLSIALVGCSKENICLKCEKQNSPTYEMCEDEVPEISLAAYNLTNQGYNCYRTD